MLPTQIPGANLRLAAITAREIRIRRKTVDWERSMGKDDNTTDKEFISYFPANFFDDPKDAECDLTEEVVAMLEALDTLDSIGGSWSSDGSGAKSIVELPAHAIPEIPSAASAKSSEVGLPTDATDVFETVALRSTARKAKKNLPNCFGSQFLHDPESADCGPCKFSNNCKKAIADEMPLLEAARKARKAHFKPSGDPKQRAFLRDLIRKHHLTKFRKALKEKQKSDKAYQRDRRANPSYEKLIVRESHKRLTALISATTRLGRDKRLQQIRGREETIIAVWAAQQPARFIHGPGASDAQVATTFEKLGGGHFTRDQARSYRLLFKRLGNPLRKTPPKIPG